MPGLASWLRDLAHAGGTGGLNWHVHALYSLKRWQATSAAIAQFLQTTQPRHRHLVLIGASAGWMMPSDWLRHFERIDSYDIDPLASRLFRWRHGAALKATGATWVTHREDAIANLPALARLYPNAVFWFDNVLGQHRYRIDDEEIAERQLGQIHVLLRDHEWGSVHDRYSGPTDTPLLNVQVPLLMRELLHGATQDEVQLQGKPMRMDDAAQQLLASVSATGTWQDHSTAGVFAPGTRSVFVPWAFKPQYCHWLEMGWVKP